MDKPIIHSEGGHTNGQFLERVGLTQPTAVIDKQSKYFNDEALPPGGALLLEGGSHESEV